MQSLVDFYLQDDKSIDIKIQQIAKGQPVLVVFDDLINSQSLPSIAKFFTVDGRHMNMSMAFLTQRMFVNNEHFRQISQNCDYFVVFKNPRNSSEIRTLAQLLTPGNLDLIEMFKQATKDPFSYLMINLTQECKDDVKYLSHLFNQKNSIKTYSKSRGQIQQIDLVKYSWGKVCFSQNNKFPTTSNNLSNNIFYPYPQVLNDSKNENTESNQNQVYSISQQTEPSQNSFFEQQNTQLPPISSMSMKRDKSVKTYGDQSSSTQTEPYQNTNFEQPSTQLNQPIFSIDQIETQPNSKDVTPSQNVSSNIEYDEDVSIPKQISADDNFLSDFYNDLYEDTNDSNDLPIEYLDEKAVEEEENICMRLARLRAENDSEEWKILTN